MTIEAAKGSNDVDDNTPRNTTPPLRRYLVITDDGDTIAGWFTSADEAERVLTRAAGRR